ncbi:hypothetical protein FB446DRAFT_323680 [Lentinula raphanica]|nr:hypothetical protein C8R42DRAFT_227476 [Lentinula raphanica]KAJ3767518.1 hypothetical protein FB446DRAFT_323680 [Lentinula raphanica]
MLGNILFLFLALLGVQLVGNVAGAPSSATEIVPDLEGLSIGDIINALGIGLVQNITAIITLDSLTTNLIDVDFTAKNPLIIELTLDKVSSIAGVNNTVYASFNHTFDPPVVVRPLETADSGTIDNVLLVQGAINSLNIIPLGELDLMDVNISVRAATIDGFGGIPIPINGLKQSDVPTTYTLDID